MDDFLKLPERERRLLFEQAQARLGLPPASIEKDFWVCWTLRELLKLPGWGPHFTFKGGTSLSKAWKLIERLSEDVDLVVSRQFLGFGAQTLSGGQQKKLIKKCSERIQTELKALLNKQFQASLPANTKWLLEVASIEEDPDQQTLLFHYPRALPAASYLRPSVKIEMGARSDTEPSENPTIVPYLAEAFPEELGQSAFSVKTVAPHRTFWEKAMLLHEETYRPPDKKRKARMARHYYDLWCLINKGVGERAVAAEGLFERVAEHRAIFFRYNWMDYSTLRRGSLHISPLPDQVAGWEMDYKAMQGEMFFGATPEFSEVLKIVSDFERRFNQR